MPITINPTLIIGLGGTGKRALLELKKKLRERYSNIPKIEILNLDIDNTENHTSAIQPSNNKDIELTHEDLFEFIKDYSSHLSL